MPYKVFLWNGNDCLPGKREDAEPPQGEVVSLGTIPAPRGAKAEGITVLGEDDGANLYDLLIVYDGPAGGNPTRFRAAKPQ